MSNAKEFDWSLRIQTEMEEIEWTLKKYQDAGLFNKSYYAIESNLKKLITDVQIQTREDQKKQEA